MAFYFCFLLRLRHEDWYTAFGSRHGFSGNVSSTVFHVQSSLEESTSVLFLHCTR